MPKGRPRLYASDAEKMRAYREKQAQLKRDAAQAKLDAIKHEAALRREARGMSARLLREWIRSAAAETYVKGRVETSFEHEHDRIKIVKYVMCEATRLENEQ